MSTGRLITVGDARAIGAQVMRALGTPATAADQVAQSLASANLCGHDSHGLIRLPWYRDFAVDGRADPAAKPVVTTRHGAAAQLDGQHCWGQLAGALAVDVATDLARTHGVALVTARNANHLGRLGEYAEALADKGLVSIMWCNADPAVAPFGGRQRMLGTNPFAAGIPAGDQPAVIVDFATAAIAEGKLRLSRLAGEAVPTGLIQDAAGRPTTDPEDFYAGGTLLPFGLHKGFGLAVMIELLGGALSGNHVGFLPEYSWGNGLVLIALAPAAVGDAAGIGDEVARATATLRDSAPMAGVDRVRLPGDVERETRNRRSVDGIPVSAGTWASLEQLAADLGLTLEQPPPP